MRRKLNVDIQAILARYSVEFITRGANVKRGNINIKCPFCGAADPSHHMGIFLDTGGYACWRNKTHRGGNPARLLSKLINVSFGEAARILGINTGPDLSEFNETIKRFAAGPQEQERKVVKGLTFPRHFRRIVNKWPLEAYWYYLMDRGFDDVRSLCDEYSLLADLTGDMSSRIILPVIQHGLLVGWSGRAIGRAELRYKDLAEEDCAVPIKQTLYNGDEATTGRYLIVVEGQFDVLKADFYGKAFDFRTVGLYTNSMTDEQLYALMDASDHVEKVFFAMDMEKQMHQVHSSMMLWQSGIRNAAPLRIPGGYKDFGDVPPHKLVDYFQGLYESLQ